MGSLPCIPARRDLQTGRPSFLHRSWGPMEPFDISMPQILARKGIYSHLVTDHYHYFEDGGAGYHTKFNSYEFARGQEGDLWKGIVDAPLAQWREKYHQDQFSDKPGNLHYHYMANREYIHTEEDFPSTKTFNFGLEFIDRNHLANDWFLQIETFDPHEPFYAPDRHREPFPTDYRGPIRDWPPYARVTEGQEECDEMRANYKALLAHCDVQLGRVLDKMDALDMWKDTMLIVSTDHGYLLGEHDWWAKNKMPVYDEIAHIPLFVHHPGHADLSGQRRSALTQTADLMPTILEAFGVDIPDSVTARSVFPVLKSPEARLHEALIYGYFGGAVNVTDGRYTYFCYPENMSDQELYQYTLMPCHMLEPFSKDELMGAEIVRDLPFALGYPVMRIPLVDQSPFINKLGPKGMFDTQSALYDRASGGQDLNQIDDQETTRRLSEMMVKQMAYHSAPPEAYRRLGLAGP